MTPKIASKKRSAKIARKTAETDIELELSIDGDGKHDVSTGIPFMDHMLDLLARHALFDLTVKARGDLDVDYHHTVEDLGLVLGETLDQALGNRLSIFRFGWSMIPMDESLSQTAVDLGGRPHLIYKINNKRRKIRDFDVQLIKHFFESFCQKGRFNLHIEQLYGDDVHHAYESVFKSVARALYMACAKDPRVKGVPSSKGRI